MTTASVQQAEMAKQIQQDWDTNPRWQGVERTYSALDVVRLRGSVQPECTFARNGADKLWRLVNGAAQEKFGKTT